MKKKIYLASLLLINLFYSSCDRYNKIDEKQEEENRVYTSLINTSWKLTGIGDLKTGKLTLPPVYENWNPNKMSFIYTIVFVSDSTFDGFGTVNRRCGWYHSDSIKRTIEIFRFGGTKIDDATGYEENYEKILLKSKTYEIVDSILNIYLDDDSYLKYISIEKPHYPF